MADAVSIPVSWRWRGKWRLHVARIVGHVLPLRLLPLLLRGQRIDVLADGRRVAITRLSFHVDGGSLLCSTGLADDAVVVASRG